LRGAGFAGYDGTALVAGQPTGNFRLTGTALAVTPGGSLVNSLNIANSTTTAVAMTFTNATDVLNLTSGGLLVQNAVASASATTIGGTPNSGIITAGGATPVGLQDLYLSYIANGSAALTINSKIADNGASPVRFVVSGGNLGANSTILQGTNTYSGGTVLNRASLTVGATGSLPGGGITLNGSGLTQTAGGTIASQALTLNGPSTVFLAGANSLTSLTFNNTGSGTVFSYTGSPTLTVGFDNSHTFFSGQISRFNDGTPGGVALTKVGTGTLHVVDRFRPERHDGLQRGGHRQWRRPHLHRRGRRFPRHDHASDFRHLHAEHRRHAHPRKQQKRRQPQQPPRLEPRGPGHRARRPVRHHLAVSTSELLNNVTLQNGGGFLTLLANSPQQLTTTITTLGAPNANGSGLFHGIADTVASGNANLIVTNANFQGSQGGGTNGTTTMSVRPDILGDASYVGLGTGFLTRDSVVTNLMRPLTAGELQTNVALWATTQNAGLSSAQTIGATTLANTITASGTASLGSALNSTFGSYGANGGLLPMQVDRGGILALNGSTLNFNPGALNSNGTNTWMIHAVGNAVINVNGVLGGTPNGIVKADDGTLNLNQIALYTGSTVVNGGTLNLNSGQDNTIPVIPTATTPNTSNLQINGITAVVDLKNRSQAIGSLSSSNPLPGYAGMVTNSGITEVVLTSTGGGTFSGQIAGNLGFTRSGNTTLLTNANTYTGPTIIRGGTLQLRDSGSILNSSSIAINYGTLLVDQFGLNPLASLNPTRVAATTPITMQGGALTLNGAGSTDNTLTVNSLTVAGGGATINVLPQVNEGSTARITIGNLVRTTTNHSVVNFNGFTFNNSSSGTSTLGGQGLSTNGQIILNQFNGANFTSANLTNNLIGGWAVADGNTFATYVDGFGVSVMGQTTAGIVAPAFNGTDISAATTATQNISDGSSGNPARTLTSGAHLANSWRFFQTTASATMVLNTGATISLGVGIIANSNQVTTIQGTDGTNTLTSPNADLYVFVNQNTTNINTKVTGAIALVKGGSGVLGLGTSTTPANNDYSLGTFVQGGTLNLNGASGSTIIPAGPAGAGLVINNATVTQNTNVQQIANTTDVVINGGGALNLTVGTNFLNSLTFNNLGGTANPSVNAGASTLFLASATPITATNDSLATTPVISGVSGLALTNAAPVINVSGLSPVSLQISTTINATGGAITKIGTGALVLSGASTFTTGFNLNQGTLIFGASTTGGISNGPVGTGTLAIAGGTTVLSDGGVRTIANATTIGGNFTFGGVTSGNSLILSGAMNLGASGRTITVTSAAVTGTLGGALTSTATGTTLTKAGRGALVLSAANTTANFGSGSIAVAEGILKNGINNAIANATPLFISAGAGYDLNAFDQALLSISGTGFVTNSGAQKTLTIGATAATDVTTVANNTFAGAFVSGTAGNLIVAKAGLGTLTLTNGGVSQYAGTTTSTGANLLVVSGNVIGTATNAFPSNGTATVGNATTAANSLTATLDTGAFDQSLSALVASPNAAAGTAVINVATGKTLTVNGNVTLGSNTSATDVTNVNFTGGGNLVVTKDGGTFQVGGATGSTNTNTVNANMSALANFTANLGTTGIFRVGSQNGTGGSSTNGLATLTLAPNNTITASTLSLGESTSEQVAQTLRLGSGANVFNANVINVGSNTGRGAGVLNFATGTGTLVVRAADGAGRAAFNMVNGVSGTGAEIIGTADLLGHNADLLLGTLTMAARSSGNTGNGSGTATFSFDTGTLDVTTVNASDRSGTNTNGQMTSTIYLGGGTVNIGMLNLATNSSASGTATGGSSATVNVSGGVVTIDLISMANVTGATANKATSTLNLTGGSVTVNSDITRTTATGTQSTTLTLNGSVLDLTAHNIGTAATPIQTLNFQSGTLRNVNEINGGASLIKTTAGTLILTGTNAYTGTTNVAAGTVSVQSVTGLGSTIAGTSVTAGATLEINNAAVGNEALTLNGTGVGSVGALTGVGTASLSGNVALNTASSIGVAAGADTLTLDGRITGANSLTKGGAGTLEFTGASSNTYSGVTTISAGTIALNKASGVNAIIGNGASDKITADILIAGGTLSWSANDQVHDSVFINMTSGSFNLNGRTETIYDFTNSGGSFSTGVGGNLTITDHRLRRLELLRHRQPEPDDQFRRRKPGPRRAGGECDEHRDRRNSQHHEWWRRGKSRRARPGRGEPHVHRGQRSRSNRYEHFREYRADLPRR
jgi:autotransporter-associated beta strand protein